MPVRVGEEVQVLPRQVGTGTAVRRTWRCSVSAQADDSKSIGVRISVRQGQLESLPMRFGIDVAQQRLAFDEIVERVGFGEQLGFEGAWGFDHFVPMYGEGPGECFEGMTTLGALATATSAIRLGLLVTGVTYRHPSVLAAEAVTVDHASHGRLELALGAAWYEREHHQLGIEFPPLGERFDRLEDTLEIITRLATGDVVSYDGHHFSLAEAQMRPVYVQQPHPPIWIGGSGPRRTLPLVARYADVWHGPSTAEEFTPLSARIDELAVAAGRDPASIRRASSLSLSEPDDVVRANIETMARAGVSYLVCGWPGEGKGRVETFAGGVMADYLD
jgi:F420-dependent oxidoreductase-like protein